MKIENISAQPYYRRSQCAKPQTPSFGSVYPVKYFVKAPDGMYSKVTDAETVRKLQGKLISMLNKGHNDCVSAGTKKRTAESPQKKSLRQKLVNYFFTYDPDYARESISSSFFPINSPYNHFNHASYLLTGKSAEITDRASEPIVNINARIRRQINIIKSTFGVDETEARKRLNSELLNDQHRALQNYQSEVGLAVRNALSRSGEKPVFNAGFTQTQKGKKVSYVLSDMAFTIN